MQVSSIKYQVPSKVARSGFLQLVTCNLRLNPPKGGF